MKRDLGEKLDIFAALFAEDLSLQGADLSRGHYSRLLGPLLIYCMGDILTPPRLYIVPARICDTNKLEWARSSNNCSANYIWMEIQQHWSIQGKKGNLQALIKMLRVPFANFKPITCRQSVSIVSLESNLRKYSFAAGTRYQSDWYELALCELEEIIHQSTVLSFSN